MSDPRLDINCVIVDCLDPEGLAAFWSALLGRSIAGRTGPYVWLERVGGLGMGFQKVAEPTVGKNRLHLDLASVDPVAEQQRIEALGGRRLPEYAPSGFLVMADPEGNEFCVIPDGPLEMDDEGRVGYLNDHAASDQGR
jgi:predicted enzyme related to lactoylglutathione lyase